MLNLNSPLWSVGPHSTNWYLPFLFPRYCRLFSLIFESLVFIKKDLTLFQYTLWTRFVEINFILLFSTLQCAEIGINVVPKLTYDVYYIIVYIYSFCILLLLLLLYYHFFLLCYCLWFNAEKLLVRCEFSYWLRSVCIKNFEKIFLALTTLVLVRQ